MVRKEDFFTELNHVSYIPEEEYTRLDSYIEAFDAVARTTYKSMYIIDYYKRNFLYVSSNPFYLCGMTAEQVQAIGYDFYLKFVPKSEHELLLKANRAGFQFAEGISPEQWKEYTISYDFHIHPHGKIPILINHKITPLKMSQDGHLWLAFCTASLSAASSAGNIVVTNLMDNMHWVYRNDRWEEEQFALTKREKDVVDLLVQGKTIKEIAENIYRSEDTIKLHQKNIYKKLQVEDRIAAILAIINKKRI